MSDIRHAETDADLERCYPVMRELRPHLDRDRFIAQVRRQSESERYRIVFTEDGGDVTAVAGYRLVEMLAWGKALYLDDLVTAESHRDGGYGSRLFDWLIEEAGRLDCDQFHLDSGVQRFATHRFYLHKGMDITSHHFAIKLRP